MQKSEVWFKLLGKTIIGVNPNEFANLVTITTQDVNGNTEKYRLEAEPVGHGIYTPEIYEEKE